MKKLFGTILTVFIANLMCFSVYAKGPAVEILNAQAENNAVTFNAKITDPVENQQLTVVVAAYENGRFDYDSIVYINQYAYTQEEISFEYAQWADTDKVYAIKVGGTDIEEPAYLLLDTEDNTLLYGDVDSDGVITANDSVLTLQYVLNPNSVELSQTQLQAAGVNGSIVLSANDSACILQKALNNAYKFVVELAE